MPDSKALRVRVDLSRKSMKSVLSEEAVRYPVAERRLQLARDGHRLVDLLDRPVERLDEVAADEGLSVDCQL